MFKPNTAKNPAAEDKKIRGRWKAKDTSAVEDRRLSACAVLHDRDEKIFQGGMGRAPMFRDPQNIIKDERKLQRYCCSFCCQPQRILICCKKSSLPECLAQSSYWQTLLYLTYMCFFNAWNKKLQYKNWKYEEEILKSLLLHKENSMPYTLLSIKSVSQSMLLSVQANHKGADDCLHFFLSFLHAKWPANSHLPKAEFTSPWLQIINSHKRKKKPKNCLVQINTHL